MAGIERPAQKASVIGCGTAEVRFETPANRLQLVLH
jgi:hypothetical protein